MLEHVPVSPRFTDPLPVNKVGRKRHLQMRRFATAALRIVSAEGLSGLTMARIAEDLDTVPSALYRYFPSKAALITAVQCDAIERLTASYELIHDVSEEHFARASLTADELVIARLVMFGRWFCATSETHLPELRLMQMIMSERTADRDVEGGFEVLPVAMVLLGQAAERLAEAAESGQLDPGPQLERVIIWAACLGGVLETDSLSPYIAELGGGRLARVTNLDLLRGWGAPPELLDRATTLIDDLARAGSLAPIAPTLEG